MLYFDIVLKSFYYIFSNYPLDIFIILFFFIVLLYFTWLNIRISKSKNKYIIIIIRLILIILLLPILIDKNYNYQISLKENQNIGILIDNSISTKNSLSNQKNFFLDSFYLDVQDLGLKENFTANYYNLDSLTNYNDIIFNSNFTNFDFFNKILKKDTLDQFILLSDGNINSGKLNLSYNKKINIIGIGKEKSKYNNIKISNIINNQIGDSISFNVELNINLINNSEKAIFTIHTNDQTEKIYSDTLLFMKGNYNFSKKLMFESKKIKKNYFLSIELIDAKENNLSDNIWKKNINDLSNANILFLTGKISYNTTFIKEILKNINGIEFNHYMFLNDANEILLKDYEYLILDNFPANKAQISYLKKMIYKNKNLTFFEGTGNSSSVVDSVINLMFKDSFNFINDFSADKRLNLHNNFDLGPINKKYKVFNLDNNNDIFFSDSSIAIINSNKMNAVLIPNLGELDFYQKNKYEDNKITIYFKDYLKKSILNKDNINLSLNKQSYYKGEKLLFNLDLPKYINNKNIMIYINNIKSNSIDSFIYNIDNNIYLETEGEYRIYPNIIGTKNNEAILNSKILTVLDNSIEEEVVFQNIDFLKNIAKLSNGEYVNSEQYSKKYLRNINFSSINTINRNIYNALDVFIKDLIYLYVIILFALEIYLRKRIGLM